MGEVIVMLPESLPVAIPLVEYVFGREGGKAVDLLILEKQRETFGNLIGQYAFRKVYVFNEEYYGGLKDPASLAFMRNKAINPYDTSYFPVNTFRANAFLFGSIIAGEALAVNSSLFNVRESLPETTCSLNEVKMPDSSIPWAAEIATIRAVLAEIIRILSPMEGTLKVSGERPNLGILKGFGHDLEIFMKYAYGIGPTRGARVLDIGGGLGYGAYLLSKFADEVVFLDRSAETTDFVGGTWAAIAPNLKAVCGEASDLKGAYGEFDTVFLMDVIEHVEDPEGLLEDVKSLLKSGGTLVLSTPEEDYYPYRVCPVERRGEAEAALIGDAIWPWHIQGLGEAAMMPMLKGSGFEVIEKSYLTYVKGYEIKKRLVTARQGQDPGALFKAAEEITKWDVDDFGLTTMRDPCFSAASYNIVAKKEA